MSTLNIQQTHQRFLRLLSSLKLSDGFHTSVHPQFIRPVPLTNAFHRHVLQIQMISNGLQYSCLLKSINNMDMIFKAIVLQIQKNWRRMLKEIIYNTSTNVMSLLYPLLFHTSIMVNEERIKTSVISHVFSEEITTMSETVLRLKQSPITVENQKCCTNIQSNHLIR